MIATPEVPKDAKDAAKIASKVKEAVDP